jgi:alpha-L-fucosidase 2
LQNLAPYPKGKGPFGEVWLDVVDALPEFVYNVPTPMAPVFPGEQVGIGIGEEFLEVATRTAGALRFEGGDYLVFQPLIRARLGNLDLEWFKRQVRYCMLPNGACSERCLQIGGRFTHATDFDFLKPMGIWIQNLSLPVVINECLMQSYTGTIHLFPNRRGLGRSAFHRLRVRGAFLVTAEYDGASVSPITLFSEKGAPCRLATPWNTIQVVISRVSDGGKVVPRTEGGTLVFSTEAGQEYVVKPA